MYGYDNLIDKSDSLCHLDQKKAFTQFKLCPEYMGFLGKVTDFRVCDSVDFAISNIGLYLIDDIKIFDARFKLWNDKLRVYMNNVVYTSADLKFLNKVATFKVLKGCWGASPFHFEFPESMIYDEKGESKMVGGTTYFAKWVGTCDRMNLTRKFYMKGSKEYFENMAHYVDSDTTVEYFKDGVGVIEYPATYAPYKGHITAFITAYQRLNM